MDKRNRRRDTVDVAMLFEHGKVPPQDVPTETAILGAILMAHKDIDCQKVLQVAKPEHFYKSEHQIVFSAMLELWADDAPIDILTVTDKLRSSGELELVGGAYYIGTLTNGIAGSSHLPYWFHKIIYPKFLRREIIKVCSIAVRDSFEDDSDVFDKLDELIEELSACKPDVLFKPSHTAKSIGEEFSREMGLTDGESGEDEPAIGAKKYLTRHKKFNDIVSICENKIILSASHKAGLKSRFWNEIATSLLEDYPDEIALFWVSLEDDRKEQLRIWLSRKLLIRPDKIKFGVFDKLFKPTLSKLVQLWESFDMKIWDGDIKIKTIGTMFKQFVAERPGKLCLCIIDNVLSLSDHDDYKGNEISMHEYVGREILRIKRQTRGLILPIHHLNDDASVKSELAKGYRPSPVNIKGSGIWKQVAYQTILINYPRYYKDLIAQYSGDQKTVLENIWILDVATNRSHKEIDEESLIRYFVEPDFCLFEEISDDFETPIPEYVPPIKHDSEEPF